MADGPLITPDALPQIIPDVVPRPVRQFAAGVATIPGEALKQAAILANPMRFYRQVTGQATPEDAQPNPVISTLEGAGTSYNNLINKLAGVDDPDVLDDTGNAAARFLGNSLPAAPLRLPSTLAYAAANAPRAVRIASEIPLKLAEMVTPLSLTSSTTLGGRAANVAANVAAQTVISGGVQAATEPVDPTAPQEIYDADGKLVSEFIPEREPGVGRVVARGVAQTVGEHPYLSAATGVGLAGLAALARRGTSSAAAQRALQSTSDVLRPAERGTDDVPIIAAQPGSGVVDNAGTTVRNTANAFAEGIQDANIRTKDAVQQVNPDRFEEVRDAIDIVSPQAHADRQLALAEQGRLLTPRGERQVLPLRRWAEGLYHQSIRDPELNVKTKELLIMENELDARDYANKRGVEKVMIDKNTFQRADSTTAPADIISVTPRATLHHIDDAELRQRIQTIRNTTPNAAKYADQFHKLHSDLADAWVDMGILSPQERALWGRANPHFMHTINMEDAKSPRTYRIRGHGEGPQYGGDPILSALEYQDFMLAHSYTNRMRQSTVEALRQGGGGQFGNSKWIGKVAHPAEMRNQYVPVAPGSVKTRQITLDDINPTGDVLHYYDRGERVHVEIKNKQLLNTMKMRPTHAATFGGWVRQLAQSGMTGKIATLVGQPFSIANAIQGGLAGMVNRPAGMSFGYLDAAMQRMTGGKVGFRGDPTAVAGMINSAARDTAAIVTRATSEALYNSIDAGGLVSKLLGPQRARALADGAARRYMESMHAKSSLIGSGNASTLGERDFDAGGRATMISTVTPHGNAARIVGKPEDIREAIQLWTKTVVPADVKIAVRMVNDINEAIGNMAQTFLFRSNFDKVEAAKKAIEPVEDIANKIQAQAKPHLDRVEQLRQQGRAERKLARAAKGQGNQQQASTHYQNARTAYAQAKQEMTLADPYLKQLAAHMPALEKVQKEWFNEYASLGVATRQLLGDAGQMGTALRDYNRPGQSAYERAVGWTLNNVPYANISMQAGARLIRAAKENPGGTAAAISLGIAPLALYPIAMAIHLDDEDKKNGGPGGRVAYELSRPSWDAVRNVMVHMRGVPTDESPRFRIDPLLSPAYTFFRELLMRAYNIVGDPERDPTIGYTREAIMHIAGIRTWSNVKKSLENLMPIGQFPPIISGPAALAGFQLPELSNIGRGATAVPQGGQGGFENTRLSGGMFSRNVEAAFGMFLGGAGQTLVSAINQGSISESKRPGSGAAAALGEVAGRSRARMPEFQPLYHQPIQRAASDPIADSLSAKDAMITNIQKNLPSVNQPDTVGRGRYAERTAPGEGRTPVHESMRPVLNATAEFGRSMDLLRDARGKQRERIIAVDQSGQDYVTRLRERNRLAADIKRINAELMARYTRFEDRMSERLGRRFRIDEINPTKPVDQFERLR